MLDREKVIETIQRLPEKFSFDEVLDRIIILEKIEIGLQQVKENQVVSDEELDERLKKWLSWSGRNRLIYGWIELRC